MPTAFVDRDGVINVNRPDHVKSWDEFVFLRGALAGLQLLTRHGFNIVVVTNQAIVNRGIISHPELDSLHARMVARIADHGGRIGAVLFCPHRPDEGCGCRKPAPGLLFSAQDRLGVDLRSAVLIGDHPSDLEAARGAGCPSILVRSGRLSDPPALLPDGCIAVVPDLLAAARHLVAPRPVVSEATMAQRGTVRC